jgi:sialidase-1
MHKCKKSTIKNRTAICLTTALVMFAMSARLAITKSKPATGGVTVTSAGHPSEDKIEPFLGDSKLDMKQVFKGGRFPNVVTAVDGTVLAFWSGVKVSRSEDGGKTWGQEILVGKGFMGGGVTVNETNGEILAFVEKSHPPAPLTVYRSKDHGKTWSAMKTAIKPDSKGNVPNMHMNEHGITLRHGKNAGRIIRPSRHYAGANARNKWPEHYTNAIYSDDGGKTWQTSEPFGAMGTGEATLAELSNGTIYYNSRRHWAQPGADPRRRWTAQSTDGGATWTQPRICQILPDGPQNTNYGCMAGLVRLPVAGKDILIYSNCDSPGGRHHMTVWASFDGGRSWPLKRLVFAGSGAYSSLNAGRPKTKSEGWIYLNFEGGPKGGSTVARFNLSWLLEGKKTGNGKVPKEFAPEQASLTLTN